MCGINYLIFELPNKTMAKLYTIVNKTVGASSPERFNPTKLKRSITHC
jgi:hypothetical protein